MGKSKSKKGSTDHAASSAADATKREEPLQAILLADVSSSSSSSERFRPISLDRPKVLCPLNNVALIDYALDFLAGAGVQQVVVVCVADQVQEHVKNRHASSASQNSGSIGSSSSSIGSSSMDVTVVKDSFFGNEGDALREIDKRGLIQSDPFILMFADTVTNVDLVPAMEAHKARNQKDSRAVMTMLMKPIGNNNNNSNSNNYYYHYNAATTTKYYYESILPAADDLVIGVDPTHENRVLVYDNNSSNNNNKGKKRVQLPCSFFATHNEIELHCADWLDTGIDICSVDVLARISDNFDYGSLRHEFVANSVAEEEEGLQNQIFCHLLQSNEYAARVHDFYTYAAISRDLLRRWCYPVVPDHNHHSSLVPHAVATGGSGAGGGPLQQQQQRHYQQQYAMQRHYMYRETRHGKIRVGRSSRVTGPGMIGSSCYIAEGCVVEGTVLGNFCHVGQNALVRGCHVWDGVDIGPSATVIQSVLADGVVVKAGAVVNRGCCIGAGCVVGENVVLQPFTRLTLKKEEDEDDFGDDWGDDDDDDDESEEEEDDDETPSDEPPQQEESFVSDEKVVGSDGKGRVWKPQPEEDDSDAEDDDDDDDDDHGELTWQERLESQSMGFDCTELYKKRREFQQEPDDDFSDVENMDDAAAGLLYDNEDDAKYGDAVTFAPGPASLPVMHDAAAASQIIIGRQKGVDVIKELKGFCLEYELSSPIENLAIELNSFKFSQNATYSDCTIAATMAILERMNITKDTKDGKLIAEFKSALEHWAPLLRKMSIGQEEEEAIVLALERCATGEGGDAGDGGGSGSEMAQVLSTGMSFRFLLQTLFDEEIVSEEAILAWADKRKNDEGDETTARGKLFRLKPIQDFLEWLREESEDGSDDDESDDDDDDSEGS